MNINSLCDKIAFNNREFKMNRVTSSLQPKLEATVKKSLAGSLDDETTYLSDFFIHFNQSHEPETHLKELYKKFIQTHSSPNEFWKKDLNLRTYACVMRFFKSLYFWKRVYSNSSKISAKFVNKEVTVKISLVALQKKAPVGYIRTEIEFIRGPEKRVFHVQPLEVKKVTSAPKLPKLYPLEIKHIYTHLFHLPYSKTSYIIRRFDHNSQVVAQATWNLETRSFTLFKPGARTNMSFSQVDLVEVRKALAIGSTRLPLFHAKVESIIFRLWDIRVLPKGTTRDAVNLLLSFRLKPHEIMALVDNKPFEKRIRTSSFNQFKAAQWIHRHGDVLEIPSFVKQILYYQKHRQFKASL